MCLRKLTQRLKLKLAAALDAQAVERAFVEKRYELVLKRKPNLDRPRTFSEKLCWLNLNYRNPLLPVFVDKYASREFVETVVGADLLPPLLGVYESADDIDFEALPDAFALKVTSGSTWNIICANKASLDIAETRQRLNGWMKERYFWRYHEWPYKNVKARIIAEPFMAEANHPERSSPDWKFWCFDGQPRFVSICFDRRGDQRLELFDCDTWEPMPFTFGNARRCDTPLQRPAKFDQTLDIVKKLAANLPFIRVDLYEHQDRIVFGELTVYPYAGYIPMNPVLSDLTVGHWLTLPTEHLAARRALRQELTPPQNMRPSFS